MEVSINLHILNKVLLICQKQHEACPNFKKAGWNGGDDIWAKGDDGWIKRQNWSNFVKIWSVEQCR